MNNTLLAICSVRTLLLAICSVRTLTWHYCMVEKWGVQFSESQHPGGHMMLQRYNVRRRVESDR